MAKGSNNHKTSSSANLGFEAKLWLAADKLRSNMDAAEVMVLEDFSAARYGRLTNGGDVLFARKPAIRLPQIRIQAMCYNSDKAGDTYRDMKSIEGPHSRPHGKGRSW